MVGTIVQVVFSDLREAPDEGLTLIWRLCRLRANMAKVNSLGARTQSFICWTSEAHEAAAGAGSPFRKFAGKVLSSHVSKYTSCKQSRRLHGRGAAHAACISVYGSD